MPHKVENPGKTSAPPTRLFVRLGLFMLTLLVCYGLLAAPWPGLRSGYARAYRAIANELLGSFDGGTVEFRRPRQPGAWSDTDIAIRSPTSPYMGTTTHSSIMVGFLPTIETIALVLATPLPRRRRILALALSLLIIHLFILLRLVLVLVFWYSDPDGPWAMYHPSPFWRTVISTLHEALVMAPVCSFLVPILVWAAVSFRKGDWDLFLTRTAHRAPERPARAN